MLAKQVKQRLEEATGHLFKDAVLLQRALTHSSARNASVENYERLEFLGDRVLGLVIAEMLFHIFPGAMEGELSVRLNTLVNAETCAQIAEEIGLLDIINVGEDMKLFEGRRLVNIHADVVEALIAVIYIDNGLEDVIPFIHRFWNKRILHPEGRRRDAKTELQEWAHRQGSIQPPIYRILKRVGPDHDPVFEVEVQIRGFSLKGIGRSKRQAEQSAAERMLYCVGVWKQESDE